MITFSIILSAFDVERSLWHAIDICVLIAETNIVLFRNVRFAEEAKVDHDTGISAGTNVTVRKRVTMNLGVPWVVGSIGNCDLRFRIMEWNG